MARCDFLGFFFLQFEKHHKMIIFFSSCEQVEFYYELLLKVLSGGLETKQPEHSSVSSAHLEFLRLHGNMDQEVSILKMSGYTALFLIPYDLLCGYFGEEGRREDRVISPLGASLFHLLMRIRILSHLLESTLVAISENTAEEARGVISAG